MDSVQAVIDALERACASVFCRYGFQERNPPVKYWRETCVMLVALVAISPARTQSEPHGSRMGFKDEALHVDYGESCEGLASLKLPDTTMTVARAVGSGAFTPPGPAAPPGAQTFRALTAFCRVAATLKPTSDSDIKIEVWLPVSGWNGKFQAVGNGGWAGTISYQAMAEALRRGYATTSTDTGHAGAGGSFALGHPEKFIDFAYRSEHEMTVKAKAIVNAFYGSAPTYSYWNGCSTGGRQGLAEVQRYPNDFDGVIAGAQANPRTHLNAWQLSIGQAALKDPAASIPRSKYPAIHKTVVNACDALDGVTDGLISDQRGAASIHRSLCARATMVPSA